MSEARRLDAELNFIFENLAPFGRAVFVLSAALIRADHSIIAERLVDLASSPACPRTGLAFPSDAEIVGMLKLLPENECLPWMRAIKLLVEDDDASRFDSLMLILRSRVAN